MKNRIGIMLLTLGFVSLLCIPMQAAEDGVVTTSGFYDIGKADNVSIIPDAIEGGIYTLDADVDADGEFEVLHAFSDKLTLTFSDADAGSYYGVLLVEGTGIPTLDEDMYYINQTTAESDTVSFDIYPIIPSESKLLTLYITSNAENFDTIEIQLGYAVHDTYGVKDFKLGDVNNDGIRDAADALKALQIGAELYVPSPRERLAANVNGDKITDASDALKILQFGAGLISSWN